MDVKELRVGNYVLYEMYDEGRIEEIQIQIEVSDLCDIQKIHKMEDYKPILITKEVLLAFGGELMDDETLDFEVFDYGYIKFNENGAFATFQSQRISNYFKYIHEFQNFIFATTGFELTFNIKTNG